VRIHLVSVHADASEDRLVLFQLQKDTSHASPKALQFYETVSFWMLALELYFSLMSFSLVCNAAQCIDRNAQEFNEHFKLQ